jgi:predicted transposase YbfD/YdcC
MPAHVVMPAVLSSTAAASCDLHVEAADCGRLMELLSLVPDPRARRGVRHDLASILAIATAAVLAGRKSVLAVGEWAAEAPQELLAALGARQSRPDGCFTVPHLATFRRVLKNADAAAVDAVIGSFLAEVAGFASLTRHDDLDPGAVAGTGSGGDHPGQRRAQQRGERDEERGEREGEQGAEEPLAGALSVDGKAVRGARQADGRAVHLLSALIHGTRLVVGQCDVAHKTNEIPEVRNLLAPLDLRGWAVTLDAMHCQQETARFLVEDKKAAYVFTAVKDNQPGLAAKLDALPWQDAPVAHVMSCRGHGRHEKRTIQVLPAAAGIWPYARQAFLVERYVYDLAGTLISAVAALGLTALTADQASPERLNWLVRDHWGIEAMHWIRDTVFDEDHSQLRRGSAPQIMAGIRNLTTGLINATGRTRIAPTMRWVARNPTRALLFLSQTA